MSTQLIDNFYLNSSKPIDNRFVVGPQSYYTHRDYIDWKYEGMRVWDLNDGLPYVWTGTTYSSENTVSIGGSGTVNKIPKFATTTTVTDSIIYDDGTYVGIGNNTPVYELDVTGAIRTTDGFIGNGATISNINADNITSGTLLLNRIQNSSNNNWLLTSGNPAGPGQASWVNPTAVTVGNATNAIFSINANNSTNVNVQSISTSGVNYYLLFSTTTGNTPVYTNTSTAIRINPSNGNVGIGTGTTALSDKFRVVNSGDSISAAYTTTRTNFLLNTISTGTTINMRRFVSGVTFSSKWWSRGDSGQSYDELAFAGKSYLSVNGSGTGDSRLINFQGPGDGDAVQFYFLGNSTTVPTVGGAGVYIKNNLSVGGDVAMISPEPDTVCTKTINVAADRWVSDFTTGTNAGVSSTTATLASVNYDRIVYVIHYSSGQGGAQIQAETTAGNYKTLGRIYNLGYASTSAIIPAGKQFRIFLEHNSGTKIYDIIIYKFGRG